MITCVDCITLLTGAQQFLYKLCGFGIIAELDPNPIKLEKLIRGGDNDYSDDIMNHCHHSKIDFLRHLQVK